MQYILGESVWLQNLMKDIKITHNTQLYCDNQPAIKTVQLEVALERTKHIRRRVDFVKQQIQFSPLLLQYVLRNWIVQTYLRRHYQIHSSQTYSTMCIRYKTYWPTIFLYRSPSSRGVLRTSYSDVYAHYLNSPLNSYFWKMELKTYCGTLFNSAVWTALAKRR